VRKINTTDKFSPWFLGAGQGGKPVAVKVALVPLREDGEDRPRIGLTLLREGAERVEKVSDMDNRGVQTGVMLRLFRPAEFSPDYGELVVVIGDVFHVLDIPNPGGVRTTSAPRNSYSLCTNGQVAVCYRSLDPDVPVEKADSLFSRKGWNENAKIRASLVDVRTGAIKTQLPDSVIFVTCISKDNKWALAWLRDSTLGVIDIEKKKIQAVLKGHSPAFHPDPMAFPFSPAFISDFSPDGRRIITVAPDGHVSFWDTVSGMRILTLQGGSGMPVWARFSPNGRYIAVASAETGITLWDCRATNEVQESSAQSNMLAWKRVLSDEASPHRSSGQKPTRAPSTAKPDRIIMNRPNVRDSKQVTLTIYNHSSTPRNIQITTPDGTRPIGSVSANGRIIHTVKLHAVDLPAVCNCSVGAGVSQSFTIDDETQESLWFHITKKGTLAGPYDKDSVRREKGDPDVDIRLRSNGQKPARAPASAKPPSSAEPQYWLDRATREVEKSKADLSEKRRAYVAIAEAQIGTGDKKGALRTLGLAKAGAKYSGTFVNIAKIEVQAGDRTAAMETLRGAMAAVKDKRDLAVHLAEIEIQAGDKAGALKRLHAIKVEMGGKTTRDSSFPKIAGLQAAAGDLDAAMATAMAVETRPRAEALAQIAEAQARSGAVGGAKETAKLIENTWRRSRASFAIVEAQLKAGDVKEALLTARTIEDDGQKALAYCAIIETMTMAGDVETAREAAEAISIPRIRRATGWRDAVRSKVRAYCAVSGAQAQAGRKADAVKTLQAAERVTPEADIREWDPLAYFTLVEAYLKFNAIAEANAFASAIWGGDYGDKGYNPRILILGMTAVAQARNGDKGGAQESLGKAKQLIADGFDPRNDSFDMFHCDIIVVWTIARLGRLGEIEKWFEASRGRARLRVSSEEWAEDGYVWKMMMYMAVADGLAGTGALPSMPYLK